MSFGTSAKKKFELVLSKFGNTASLIPITVTTNTMGDKTETEGTPKVIKAVSAGYFPYVKELQPYTTLNAGESALLIETGLVTDTNAKRTKVLFNNARYKVDRVKEIEAQNIKIATRLIIMREING